MGSACRSASGSGRSSGLDWVELWSGSGSGSSCGLGPGPGLGSIAVRLLQQDQRTDKAPLTTQWCKNWKNVRCENLKCRPQVRTACQHRKVFTLCKFRSRLSMLIGSGGDEIVNLMSFILSFSMPDTLNGDIEIIRHSCTGGSVVT